MRSDQCSSDTQNLLYRNLVFLKDVLFDVLHSIISLHSQAETRPDKYLGHRFFSLSVMSDFHSLFGNHTYMKHS